MRELREALVSVVSSGTPPPPEVIDRIDVGTEKYLKFFEKEIIENYIAMGGSSCRFFEGVNGGGKSHVLRLLSRRAEKYKMLVVEIELSRLLSLRDWKNITHHVLNNIQFRNNGRTISGFANILFELARNNKKSLRHLRLRHTGFLNASDIALNRLSSLDNPAREKLKSFLSGEKIGAGDLKRHRISGVKNPLSERNAESVLNTILSIVFELGFAGTMMIFDETEDTFNSLRHSNRALIAANLMRRFIDASSNGIIKGTIAIFAVLPDFLPAASNAYPALGDRLNLQRPEDGTPGWRCPLLRLEDITTCKAPEEFLEMIIDKIISQMPAEMGQHLKDKLMVEGHDVLNNVPGLDFRRPLVKRLASKTLEYI
ncbi:MAG TPA: DUF2791 family P-loop domain-containing protein [Smithellaceae bacterium]|nr:DUF2791 family P-loop domain-containing protein [Smithellaceae bacterium]